MLNRQGGYDPENIAALERAANADLVTLPLNVVGTNCGNCRFVTATGQGTGFCNHPSVLQPVTTRMCCALWDAHGTLRTWE